MTLLVSEPVAPFLNTVCMSAVYVFDEINKAKTQARIAAGEDVKMEAGYTYSQQAKGNIMLGSTEDFVGYDRRVNFENSKAIAKVMGDVNPALREKKINVIRGFANFFPYTKDDLPVIGPVPGVEGFVMASGLNGGGMGLGIGAGYTVAQYCALGETHIPIHYFDIQRESLYK